MYSNVVFKRSSLPPVASGAVSSTLGMFKTYLFPAVSVIGIDSELVVPNTALSVYENAIFPWRGESMGW